MGKASAQIEITAGSSRLGAGLAAAYSKFQSFGGAVARGMGRTFKAINAKLAPGEMTKNAIGHAGGDLIGKGLSELTDGANAVRDFERDLVRLGISAKRSPAELDALRKSIRATSVDTGIGSAELIKAGAAYFDLTSDAAGVSTAVDGFAKVARASGADIGDVTKAAAAMADNMGIASSEFESTFSGLIEQGKAGKISLKDMGAEFPSLLAMFSKFGHGRQGVMELGAAFQVGAKAFGSASQAATGLEAMMGMLQARQAQLHAAGVEVYQTNKDGTVTLRNLHDIVKQIADKKIDPRRFGKIFGENKEGKNFLDMMLKFPKLYDDVLAAGKDTGAVLRDGLAFAESDAGRLDATFNRLKETVAAAFTPERISAFVNAVENLAGKLGPVMDSVGWIGDKIGGMYGVGQSVRGLISGNANNNPWRDSQIADSMELAGNSALDLRTMKYRTPEERVGQRKAAELRAANREAYDSTVGNIMGGEKNDRTSPESIRRAYLAATVDPSKAGNLGVQRAGDRYLEAAGVTKAEAGAQITKAVIDELKASNAKIVEALAKIQPVLKLGDDQVAKSSAKSTHARTAPR